MKKGDKKVNQRFSLHCFVPKQRRGSHVGVILSFIIFITFALFLYLVMQPAIQTGKNKQDVLDFLKVELINQMSSDLTIVTIVNDSDEAGCLKVNKTEIELEQYWLVKDLGDNVIDSKVSGEFLNIGQENFLKIYFSDEPLNVYELGGGGNCGDSTIKFILTKNEIFETKVYRTIGRYEEDYSEIKRELKIPLGSEFSFSFTNSSGGIIGVKGKDVSTNVFAEEIPIQYIDKEANIKSGFVDIIVW